MDIGEPKRTYTIEPVEDPVPREHPAEAPKPVETPGKPEPVPA